MCYLNAGNDTYFGAGIDFLADFFDARNDEVYIGGISMISNGYGPVTQYLGSACKLRGQQFTVTEQGVGVKVDHLETYILYLPKSSGESFSRISLLFQPPSTKVLKLPMDLYISFISLFLVHL